MHFDPGSPTLAERPRKCLADGSGPVDVSLKSDRVLCAANGFEHGGEYLITILQRGDLIAGEDSGPEQSAHLAFELRIADAIEMMYLVLYLLLGRAKIDDKYDDTQRREHRSGKQPHSLSLCRSAGFALNRGVT